MRHGVNKLAARIPLTVYEDLKHRGIADDEAKFKAWLNSSEATPWRIWLGGYDRPRAFFDVVRADPFGGNLVQSQVDGLNFLLDVWERHFLGSDIRWLAYCLATAFHETAQTMEPIPEYGEGGGKPYGEPTGPYGNCYYGRGYVQLTWENNYKKGEMRLSEIYGVECPMHRYPHRMLEHEPAALVLYDGAIEGWFTAAARRLFQLHRGRRLQCAPCHQWRR